MSAIFMVAVDGSDGSRRAADFAAERARQEGGALLLAHVVDWSPYDPVVPQEMGDRHLDRDAEIDSAQNHLLDPLVDGLASEGLEISCVVRHGHVAEALASLATERRVTQIFTGRRGRSRLAALIFGSVASTLVQVSPVPVTVVP
jgi:nucleotide-binding universal stress UspA family protein